MSVIDRDGANAAQIEFWDGPGGDRWTEHQEAHDGLLTPLGEAVMDALAIAPGDHVLDIGCGCGGTTLELARRVGSRGSVLGLDLSSRMLNRARERADASPGLNVTFVQADAQTHDLPPGDFDAAFSRLGIMFFNDPTAAFTRIRKALKPGGRLGFLCWRDVRENAWAMATVEPARDLVEMPPRPGPEDPGPFSFREPERVNRILSEAGFGNIALDPLDRDLFMGRSLEEAVTNIQHTGPVANAVANAPEDVQALYAERVREALTPHAEENGVLIGSACWIVTAENP